MNTRSRRATTSIALLLVFAVSQVFVAANSSTSSTSAGTTFSAQATGKLITSGNRAIQLNGNSASTGATILSGATIETPSGIGATIDLGSLGKLELAPNTNVVVEFSAGTIKVTLVRGCVILKTKRNTVGTIESAKGAIGKTEGTSDGQIDVCLPDGGNPIIGQGAAAAAGAGAIGAGATITAGSLGTITAIGTAGIGGVTSALLFTRNNGDDRGVNTSPSTP